MSNLQILEYQGNRIQFEVVGSEIMANATSMCKPFPKKNLSTWKNSKSTQEYISALKTKNPDIKNFISVKKGGNIKDSQGTWVHEKLIIDLSRWLDPNFAVWCDEKIAELLKTGKTELNQKERQLLGYANEVLTAPGHPYTLDDIGKELGFSPYRRIKEVLKEAKVIYLMNGR